MKRLTETSPKGRIEIWVDYVNPSNMTDKAKWKPLNARTWTAQIDRGLKPRKPAKGVPRPVFDPEATAQRPNKD